MDKQNHSSTTIIVLVILIIIAIGVESSVVNYIGTTKLSLVSAPVKNNYVSGDSNTNQVTTYDVPQQTNPTYTVQTSAPTYIQQNYTPTYQVVTSNYDQQSIIITMGGSTNSIPYDLTVNSDGSGVFKAQIANSFTKTIPAGTFDYNFLKQKILATPDLRSQQTDCAKSVSFGTTEQVTYNGQTSSDISCFPYTPQNRDLEYALNSIINQLPSLGINTSAWNYR